MLSYIVFCCGLLCVQAHMYCRVEEIIRNTHELLAENFETCDCSLTSSCLCLPISWTGCELSCFVDGFKRMNETLQVGVDVRDTIRHVHRSLSQLQKKTCKNLLTCRGPCHTNSTGNIEKFLTLVKTTFQQVRKEKSGKK
ncbi:interleukin-9 [Mauremys reevesii]|uniref:interleukin-9 n=1 Tax=Mauremys reevesii TaxID=260615 RepID=UPI00193F780A|nr:interleukin-9 [Mauremys reevesii]